MSGSVRSILLHLLQDRFPDTGEEVLDQVARVLARRLGKKKCRMEAVCNRCGFWGMRAGCSGRHLCSIRA